MGKKNPKPYAQRTDLEKIQSQWTKLTGHHYRQDWSAAVIRAATAAEIAVNYAIRQEFSKRSEFDDVFVDSMLLWANGIAGKVRNLLVPLSANQPNLQTVQELRRLSDSINKKRNRIAHRGEFCSDKEAAALIDKCGQFVHGLVRLYQPDFQLIDRAPDLESGEVDP